MKIFIIFLILLNFSLFINAKSHHTAKYKLKKLKRLKWIFESINSLLEHAEEYVGGDTHFNAD